MISTLTTVDDAVLAEIAEEKKIRRTKEVFVLFPLGSQTDKLIAMGLAKLGFYCLVADPAKITAEDIVRLAPKGIILSGGPASVHVQAPNFDTRILDLGIPVLGICLGFQLWAQHIGLKVSTASKREFGSHRFNCTKGKNKLFKKIPKSFRVIQSHGDNVSGKKKGFKVLGCTDNTAIAAAVWKHLYGVQFHPEVSHTEFGLKILKNFCRQVCGAVDVYPVRDEADRKILALRKQIGRSKVLLALSGGSDSSTCAYLLKHAVQEKPGRIRAVYIKGIDRPDDEAFVLKYFGNVPWLELVVVDATDRFLAVLAGHTTMKAKRKAMKVVYREVIEEQAKDFGAEFIVQGTLYTDISESAGGLIEGANKAKIKDHHNIGNNFDEVEITPLNDNVKDTARIIGKEIGVPEVLLWRHPFPGPGLVVRIEGEITKEKLRIARQADDIYIAELRAGGFYERIWQAGVVVTNSITTVTKGDDSGEGLMLMYWAVDSVNGYTAEPSELPHEFHTNLAKRFTNEIREVGSAAYRYSSKPPTTIEIG